MGYLFRLFLLALVVWLAWRFVQDLLASPKPPPPKPRRLSTDMVRCAHCGLHVPREEALFRDGAPYCSRAHLNAGARK